jgi:DNA-binding CsgD family transcriptional regulator
MDTSLDPVISEADARSLVRLVADIAGLKGSLETKKRHLMANLAKLVDADAWAWILSRAERTHNNPTVVEFLHEGMNEREVGVYVATMQAPQPPVEYAALNRLRLTERRFTRTWDQLVTEAEWYGAENRSLLERLGFEHVMYSVSILDGDGLFSGISLKRRIGRPRFTPRERRMVHIICGEVDWLHSCNETLASATYRVRALTRRQQAVLTLMLEGHAVKHIAFVLKISPNTVIGYTKEIHRHFDVTSRAELIHRFRSGDGGDLG